jgi:hypothetical protein
MYFLCLARGTNSAQSVLFLVPHKIYCQVDPVKELKSLTFTEQCWSSGTTILLTSLQITNNV